MSKIADARGRAGWIAFDFAAVPCFGIVNIFVFAPYFAGHIVGDPVCGQALWGYGQSAAGLLIAAMAPLVGAATDKLGPRKPLFALFGSLAIVSLVALGFTAGQPGAPVVAILAGVVIFSICIEYMVVVHNAMLPDLVPEASLGRWSGWSFATGYIATVGALAVIASTPSVIVLPIAGAPGVARELASPPFMALWMAACFLPFFLWTPDRPPNGRPVGQAILEGVVSLAGTFRSAKLYGNIWRYMIARAIFYDGLLAIFLFSGIFAAGLYGWDTSHLAALGIVQFLMAGLGAVLLSPIDDRIGSKRMLFASVAMVGLGTAAMILISPGGPLAMLVAKERPVQVLAVLGLETASEQTYFLLTGLTAFFIGPALASSRTMLARLAPMELMGQFFGLFSLLGRATSFVAPLAIGIITSLTQSQRAGFSTVLAFVAVGLILLTRVSETRTLGLRPRRGVKNSRLP